jgi:ribonuclease HII
MILPAVTKILPTFNIENEYPTMIVAGVDEAGRGPLCGPVVAGACIVKLQPPVLIADSKQMTAHERDVAYDWIIHNCDWSVAECSPVEIDEINILQASLLAMKRAIGGLKTEPDFVLVDGNKMPIGINGRAIVKGDAKSISIAAASIIAKVTRDRIMCKLAHEFPQYGWDKNMGYPTAAHLAAISEFGINDHYRKTFGPVKKIIDG